MNPEAQRIAIAELCGWEANKCCDCPEHWHWGISLNERSCRIAVPTSKLPDYLNDLNAIQSAVLQQEADFRRRFSTALSYKSSESGKLFCELVASDWAEVFLQVKCDSVK